MYKLLPQKKKKKQNLQNFIINPNILSPKFTNPKQQHKKDRSNKIKKRRSEEV